MARLSVCKTPKPGYHARYRCPAVGGNQKLAADPEKPPDKRTLIETRGEGGYFLAEPCPPECHPTKRRYEHHSGPPVTELPTITSAEREVLIRCARSFDRWPHEEQAVAASAGRPGDDYNARGPDWSEILGPHGWACARQDGAKRYWRRPGKDLGWSATTGVCHNKTGHESVVPSAAGGRAGEDG